MKKVSSMRTMRLAFLVLINSAVLCITDSLTKNDINVFGISNFVVGIAETVAASNSSSKCSQDMKVLLEDIQNKELWALKLIDAYGNAPISFSWGSNFWFTSRYYCEDLNTPFIINLSPKFQRNVNPQFTNSSSPFPVEYRMVYFHFESPMQIELKMQHTPIIEIGLCSPQSCTKDEIVQYSKEYFDKKIFKTQKLLDIEMTPIGTKVPHFSWNFFSNTSVIIFAVYLVFMAILTLLAAFIQIARARQYEMDKLTNDISKNKGSGSIIEKFIMCFSIKDNLQTTLKTENSNTFLSVIAGLRSIICIWVIAFHVHYHSLFAIDNSPLLISRLEGLIFQPIIQSCFYVDVFFVISAFLLVYNFLSNEKTVNAVRNNSFISNTKLYLKYLGNRYIRLTPVFITTIIISQVIYSFLDMYSPFAMTSESDLYCEITWWQNLLYINNFVSPRDMCASWGWYLACEMQFFIFFTMLLFIYIKNENLAKVIFCGAALLFVIISYICNYMNGLTFQIDVMYQTMDSLYIKPYVRINPYFGGALMGWVLSRINSRQIKLNTIFVKLFWIFGIIVFFVTILMSYWKDLPIWFVAGIMSLGRLLFGIFIGSVILLCQLGYGGYFTKIMGSKLFLFLNKFSYSMYMLAPILITILFATREEATKIDDITSFEQMLTTIAVTFAFAFPMVLIAEIPYQKISKNFIFNR